MERITTKLHIPHAQDANCTIVGTLEQWKPRPGTNQRKIALILHGTMGHKDYLFQKRVAHKLAMDSFRFDFRGNHETGGIWKQGAIGEDVEDLVCVVEYLQREYHYTIDLIIGHSRGSVVAFHWLCTSPFGKTVSGFVNASGRYRMQKIYGEYYPLEDPVFLNSYFLSESPDVKRWQEEFKSKGRGEWKIVVARKEIHGTIYPKDLEDFASWDTSIVWEHFPSKTHVLTIHGLADQTVPPYDAMIYARALGNRTPGTHNLHMMEDADHNFTNRQDQVTGIITDWWGAHQNGSLHTGVWLSDMKGKL